MSESEPIKPPGRAPGRIHAYPFWSPRFWHGMRFSDWMRLAARNRFRIHPLRIPMAALLSAFTPFNSFMGLMQTAAYGRRIRDTEITEPPVFIVGHWRSGTTYLHELMVLDDRFAYSTTFECFAPHHFLLTEWFFERYCGFLLPRRRPMDNVAAGWSRPQEDEFALLAMGVPTPYRRMAFPNEPPVDDHFLDMEGVSEADLQVWRAAMVQFLKTLTLLNHGKRIILKSPPHTGRIAFLADLFPGAKFVHITRDPYAIFPSTQQLWRALDEVQGFQVPRHENLDEYVFASLERMYRGFDKQKAAIDPGSLCETRYEDLVRDPIGELESLYNRLGLGDFEQIRARVARFAGDKQDYRTNRHEPEPHVKRAICDRWGFYFDRYGYDR